MTDKINQLKEYRKQIASLTEEEKRQRDLYLKKIANGEIYGPGTGFASIDKPWLKEYSDDAILSKIASQSLYEFYFNSCKEHLDDDAIVFFDKILTHRDILNNICKVEDVLKLKGVKTGDVIALAPAAIPEAIYYIYAANKMGVKVSIIDPRSTSYIIYDDIIQTIPKPKLFVGVEPSKKNFMKIKKKSGIEDYIFINPLNSSPSNIIKGISNTVSFINGSSNYSKKNSHQSLIKKFSNAEYGLERYSLFASQNNDYDFILHTGGTTGKHKGVELNSNALNNTVYEHKFLMDDVVKRGATFVNPLPQFITYGFTSMHLGLCKGFKMVMLPVPTNKVFTDAIFKYKPEIAFGGPIHWEGFTNDKRINNADLSFLKVPVAGGEKISLKIKERINDIFEKSGCKTKLLDGYGLSETCGVFSVALDHNTIGSVGNPLVYNNVGIFDPETDEELKIGQDGEIRITGKSMMQKYHNNQSENNRVYDNSSETKWFKTGDSGSINSNGEIFMKGRYKRIFVCGVDKVYQEAMEELICTLPYVKKCVVVAIPDDILRNVPKVHIILNDEYKNPKFEKIVISDIEKLVSERMSKNVVPKYYSFDQKLLYTPNGKVDFKNIQEQDIIELQENTEKKVKVR